MIVLFISEKVCVLSYCESNVDNGCVFYIMHQMLRVVVCFRSAIVLICAVGGRMEACKISGLEN